MIFDQSFQVGHEYRDETSRNQSYLIYLNGGRANMSNSERNSNNIISFFGFLWTHA